MQWAEIHMCPNGHSAVPNRPLPCSFWSGSAAGALIPDCNRDERMNEADAAVVKAEVVALQAVLIAVFRRMANDRPELASSFCSAFEEAEAILTGVAIKMGLKASQETTVGALKIIEEIRAGVIHDERICASG